MKKIFINILLTLVFASALVCLIFSIIVFVQLSDSPTFLVHILDSPFPYYESQAKLIETWETYLLIGISMSAISIISSACCLVCFNFIDFSKFIQWSKQKRNEARKRKIERLLTKLNQ